MSIIRPVVYTIQDHTLVVLEESSGIILWQGQPEGKPVANAVPLLGSEDCIVLLDYSAAPNDQAFSNVLRIRPDGSVVWHAELPTSGAETYVAIECEGGELKATSWFGYRVSINTITGGIETTAFTK